MKHTFENLFASAGSFEHYRGYSYLYQSVLLVMQDPGRLCCIGKEVYQPVAEKNKTILQDLKMLMNYRYDSLNCFSLVLVGEPYLNHILEKQVHEALRQRITVHYNYEGLSEEEITEYICHKLALAGGSRALLEEGALSAVHGYSEGNARRIDNLMTDALTIGAQQNKTSIDSEVIMAAANNQSLTWQGSYKALKK